MTAQEELKHLMEQHTLNMRDVARIVCRETLKPVSMRGSARAGWLRQRKDIPAPAPTRLSRRSKPISSAR